MVWANTASRSIEEKDWKTGQAQFEFFSHLGSKLERLSLEKKCELILITGCGDDTMEQRTLKKL
jgi:hypothetical protein